MASKREIQHFFEGRACETKDCIMNYTDISERISTLMQEIRDIREMNARYWELNVQTQAEHAAHATREIRLLQIKEELSRMMKMPQQKDDALATGREAL